LDDGGPSGSRKTSGRDARRWLLLQVEIPKEGESRKDVMTVEDDATFHRRNLILIAIILVLIVALLSVIFY
jgi:hypothetical protein